MAEEVVANQEVTPIVAPEVKPEVKPESKVYTQEELDRITAKVKKNARYQTRKEVEAYYQGRDSREVKEVKSNGEDKVPERGDYDSYEDFLEAKSSFVGHKAAQEATVKSQKEARERTAVEEKQKVFTDFQTKVQAKYPDLDERMDSISDIHMSDVALTAITESDLGPDILSHLADNPKECERIAALTPSSAVREIGKLEARLEGKPSEEAKQEPKKVASKAPAPIIPGGGGSPSDENPSDKDTIDEWMRKERARKRKKFG